MRRLTNDLFAVMLGAVLCAILAAILPVNSIVRLICALPLVLFFPGYTITAALLPQYSLEKSELLLFSLGLSVAVTALSGLVLDLTPWGLQTGTWAVLLAVIVLLAGAIAWLRRRLESTISEEKTEKHYKLRLRDGLFLGLAVLVTGAAIGLTRLPVSPNGIAGYTQLWMTPTGPGKLNEFRLGVNSAELTETQYRLQVSIGDQLVQEWPVLSLKPGEKWETEINLQSSQSGSEAVVADLYKLDDPATIYRHVKLYRGE